MRIRTRLLLMFLLLISFGFCMLVYWITEELGPRYLATMEESMVETATLLSSLLETQLKEGNLDTRNLRATFKRANAKEFSAKIYELTKQRLNMRVYVTDTKGIVVFDSDDGRDEGKDYSRWNDVILTLRGEYGARTTPSFSDDPKRATLYVASPIKANGEIVAVLTVCKPAESVLLFLATARRQIIETAILAALAIFALGLGVSLWVTRPIERLTRYAIAVRDGQRVAAPQLGRSEIGRLGNAFEEMKDRLEGKQYVENYVQTLTHEMKSPLSAIRGTAELLAEDMAAEQRARFLENIRAESRRIQDLVDRLLQLSSLEMRKGLREVEEIDLADLVPEVVESMEPVLRATEASVSVEAESPMVVRGERFLVRQALANLLQNAVDFSPQRAKIHLSLKRRQEDIEVRIRDEGPGIPDYALDKVFDRFYSLGRPGTGKKSSGLGLTFVREAVLLHGGQVRLENAPEGGAVATLILPCASTSAGPAGLRADA